MGVCGGRSVWWLGQRRRPVGKRDGHSERQALQGRSGSERREREGGEGRWGSAKQPIPAKASGTSGTATTMMVTAMMKNLTSLKKSSPHTHDLSSMTAQESERNGASREAVRSEAHAVARDRRATPPDPK